MDEVKQFEFLTSMNTGKLDQALAKAQGAITPATKDAQNPHFKSNYATLASVWDACRKALSENGVSVTQWPMHSSDTKLHLLTRLACDGEWMICKSSIPIVKADPQGYGSALTYLKRYSLAAAVGVATEDDDAESAMPRANEPRQVQKPSGVPSAVKPVEKGMKLTHQERINQVIGAFEAIGISPVQIQDAAEREFDKWGDPEFEFAKHFYQQQKELGKNKVKSAAQSLNEKIKGHS